MGPQFQHVTRHHSMPAWQPHGYIGWRKAASLNTLLISSLLNIWASDSWVIFFSNKVASHPYLSVCTLSLRIQSSSKPHHPFFLTNSWTSAEDTGRKTDLNLHRQQWKMQILHANLKRIQNKHIWSGIIMAVHLKVYMWTGAKSWSFTTVKYIPWWTDKWGVRVSACTLGKKTPAEIKGL